MSDSVLGICVYIKSLISHILVRKQIHFQHNSRICIYGYSHTQNERGTDEARKNVHSFHNSNILGVYVLYSQMHCRIFESKDLPILTIYISQTLLMSLLCECTYSVDYSRRNIWQDLRMVCLGFVSSNFKSCLGKL